MNVLGKPSSRVDGRLQVTGQALYAGDQQAENLAYGYLLTSTIPKGEIQSMDTEAAEQAPGVIAIYTPFNPLKLYNALERSEGGFSGEIEPPLQDRKIRYYGQIIGLIVADSFERARDAAFLVTVQYKNATATLNWDTAVVSAITPEQVEGEKATVAILSNRIASIDDALKQSKIVVEVTYREPIQHHNPLEPHATTAIWEGNRLTLYDATQGVIPHRVNVAAVLGVAEAKIRVLCPFIGGGFGSKGSMWMHSPLTAAAARTLNRPVKTILTREQMFTLVGHRPILVQSISLGATKQGQLRAVKHDVLSSVATSRVFIEAAAHRTSRFLYKSPNIHINHKLVPLDVGAPTFMRAPGVAPGMFALECAMDELAVKLGLDPVELRIKNDAKVYPGRQISWSSKNLTECYRIGAERFGWSERTMKPRTMKEGDWLVGMGMATALYPAYRDRAAVKVKLRADGIAEISSATQDLGTGTWTTVAVIGAESLGLPLERVHSEIGDSSLPSAPVSGGSQTTASVGPAIQKAAESVKRQLIQVAVRLKKSPFSGLKPEEVVYENGFLKGGNKQAEFGNVLKLMGRGAVEATEASESGEERHKYAFHSFGAQFCEVGVNQWTGEVHVRRIVSVMDIGTVVNLKTARSQIIGGIVFGIGMALLEESQLEDKTGRYANGNFADYLVATNADVPHIDVQFLNKPDSIFNPLGCRGIGEIGITGTPAAIANAIYHATAKRVRDLPITPEKLVLAEDRGSECEHLI